MAANSTRAARPAKPRADFPLFPHRNGRWAKKVRGRFCYFGKWSDDPKGEAAEALWKEQKDDLLSGRMPRNSTDGLTMRDLCNRFLTAKERQRDAGDIKPKTFLDYYATGKTVIEAFGRNRLVDDLTTEDFEALRASLARRLGVHGLSREVQQVRTLFRYAYETGFIEKPMRFGPTFKRPSKKVIRQHRQKLIYEHGERMFEAAELRAIIKAAAQPLKSMVFLGINCGFGNTDCGTLPNGAMDLRNRWIDYPRPKTSTERRCPLWPETVAAILEALTLRPKAKKQQHNNLIFVTTHGQPWTKDTPDNPITKEFRKLLDKLELHRPGLGFYALRHTFETIAGETRDQVAVDFIMGHADASMAERYRERIDDERLRNVVNHVHAWLFPKKRPK
jgi:integrase